MGDGLDRGVADRQFCRGALDGCGGDPDGVARCSIGSGIRCRRSFLAGTCHGQACFRERSAGRCDLRCRSELDQLVGSPQRFVGIGLRRFGVAVHGELLGSGGTRIGRGSKLRRVACGKTSSRTSGNIRRGGVRCDRWICWLVALVGGGLLGRRIDGVVRDKLLLEMAGKGSDRMESLGVVG